MSLSVTAAAPAPARPAPGSAAGAGNGSAGTFQSLLEALAVLPERRQVPGPPAGLLLNAGAGDPGVPAGMPENPAVPSAVLPAGGTVPAPGPAPAGFSYGSGSAASESSEAPNPMDPGAGAPAPADELAASTAGQDAAELFPATPRHTAAADPLAAAPFTAVQTPAGQVPAIHPAAAVTGTIAAPGPSAGAVPAGPAAAPAAAAAAGAPAAVENPARAGGTPVSVMAGTATADPGRVHPAAPAAPFQLAGLRGSGQPLRQEAFTLPPAPAAEAAVQQDGMAGNQASSQLPGAAPAVAQAAVGAAAAPAVPAAPPQLHAQLAKPVFSLLAAGDGEHVMTLKVTPESLGTVTVRAVIGADGVRLELFAADAGREAVRAVLPDLRRELAGSGFNATLDLGSGSRPDGEPGQEERRAPGRQEAPEHPVPAARPHDPVPSHPIPDGASALDILA